MASAKFLEEALSTDVDESAVSAIVGSLENQLVTTVPMAAATQIPLTPTTNHMNSGSAIISNGEPPQKVAPSVANGNAVTSDGAKPTTIVQTPVTETKLVENKTTTTQGAIRPLLNGLPPQTVAAAAPKPPTLVIKTAGVPGAATGLVTLPANVTATMSPANNVGSTGTQNPNIPSTLQVVNVRPAVPAQQQKGQPTRVVLSAPQIVGTRPGAPQLTLQSFHGLQPGQQGHLLLKTENGQYQLLRVGPAPAAGLNATPGTQNVTFRMQTVPATATVVTSPAITGVTTTPATAETVPAQTVQRPTNDNTKEKCRKFLANLLELSSKEPKSVERSVRTLIQELIDMKVEPEDFCDKLERLLNASPQPCLIGFLKKSLPLLRHSLVTKELMIDGIRPPPANLVFSIGGASSTVQTPVRPTMAATNQVRIVTPGAAVVRPGVLQQRLVSPVRTPVPQTTARMVTTLRPPTVATANVIVSNTQPPALHPVIANSQVRPTATVPIRPPLQVRAVTPNQIRQPAVIKGTPTSQIGGKSLVGPSSTLTTTSKQQNINKPSVPSTASRPTAKDKEKKSFSATYTGDDDINDVAAMGGVNLAEETQKILGSTEFVGTQIRSCKEDIMCTLTPLQAKIRKIVSKHKLEEPGGDVIACVSHAAQERLKNLLEKLAVITEHRLEVIKTDQRYEVTNDVKGQLKFLEDLDRAERKRHEESEREILLRAAKSRSKTEDPEQAKLKAKAKEMQRVEMEELRQREANATALQAIGPRKKPRIESDSTASSSSLANPSGLSNTRSQVPLRQRMKKVTLRDLQFLFETERDLSKSVLLYKSYLK